MPRRLPHLLRGLAACLLVTALGCSESGAPTPVDDADYERLKAEAVRVHERGRNRAKAIDLLEEVAALRPGQAGIHRRLGQLHGELKQNDDALRHFEAVLEARPDDLQSVLSVISLRTAINATGDIEPLVRQLADSDEFRGDGLYHLALLRYEAGDIDAAMALLDKARTLPSTLGYRCASLHGVLLLEEGRFAEALERFEAARRGRADYKETLNGLALTHRRLGNEDEARRWETIHRLFLDLTDDVYMKSRKRADDRAVVLEQITLAYPEWTDGFRDLADLYSKHGNTAAACRTIERLVEENPSMPDAMRNTLKNEYCGGRP